MSRTGAAHELVTVRTVAAVLRRPDLWPTALVVAVRLAAPGWWRRRPPFPLPDPAYLRFRILTAEGGSGDGPADPGDLIAYLEWRRAWPELTRRRR